MFVLRVAVHECQAYMWSHKPFDNDNPGKKQNSITCILYLDLPNEKKTISLRMDVIQINKQRYKSEILYMIKFSKIISIRSKGSLTGRQV